MLLSRQKGGTTTPSRYHLGYYYATNPRGSIYVIGMSGYSHARLFTEEERLTLKRAYDGGLNSTKKENISQIRDIAKRLKRSEEEVKVHS